MSVDQYTSDVEIQQALLIHDTTSRSCDPRSMTSLWRRAYWVVKLSDTRQNVLRVLVIIMLLSTVWLWMSRDTRSLITDAAIQATTGLQQPTSSSTTPSTSTSTTTTATTTTSTTTTTKPTTTTTVRSTTTTLNPLLQGSITKAACKGHVTSIDDIGEDQLSNIYVVDKYKALYCKVPKVASTSWITVLLAWQGITNSSIIDPDVVHKKLSLSRLKRLSQYSIAERRQLINTYFKFVFVRHPFDRLDSAFRDKFHNTYNDNYFMRLFGTDIVRRYRANPTNESLTKGDDVTLQEFLQYLIDVPDKDLNEHWQSQTHVCSLCAIHYDFVGKYDQLLADVAEVMLRLHAPVVDMPPQGLKHTPWSDRFKDIPTKVIEHLKDKYAADFNVYGAESFNPVF